MAISFSASAKAEVCLIFPKQYCCALAECFGILLYCNSFQNEGIKIITESREFAYILPKLFKKAFNLNFDSYPSLEAPGKLVFQIWDEEKIDVIMESFGFDAEDTVSLHLNLPIVESDCCKAAFLRGAFLAGGSVTDPGKGYHMEITTTHQSVAKETNVLIREAMAFSPKMAARGGGQVLYLYNRVETMERPLAKLQGAFPEARIATAHGQMDKEELDAMGARGRAYCEKNFSFDENMRKLNEML